MIADFHAHYAMHLVPEESGSRIDLVTSPHARARMSDRIRFGLIRFASRFANYETFGSGPRVTLPLMRAGGVGVALSVLYRPFCEMDLTKRYGAPPDPSYFPALLRQLELVEHDITEHDSEARIVRSPGELDVTLAEGRIAIVHCVEGAFHLGATPEAVDSAVGELAERGVAYITLAHLFWRSVATNAPAIPFIPDRLYDALFRQPRVGLTELGEAAVRAMARERVLIDLSHMDRYALARAFALLDRIDPGRTVPVVATHVGYRFGRQAYNLDEATVQRVVERGGVIGLILAEHQAADGLRRARTASLDDSLSVLFRHIDRIGEIAGSHRHVAIGSDLDGYIKPTLAGLDNMGALARLETALVERYGAGDAELITSGNILRLLRTCWGGRGGGKTPKPRAKQAVERG